MKPIDLPLSQINDIKEGALILIDKPLTWTSFDVVNKIRYFLKKNLDTGRIKVGHAGTLDPLATGLLIVCVGKYTKRIDEIQKQKKEYQGTLELGATTPSYDLETEIDHTFPTDSLSEDSLIETAQFFEGDIEQIPPIYSAVKVQGVRSYKNARQNKIIQLNARTVSIEHFKISSIQMPEVKFTVSCSTGTYIRSLVHDFGKKLGNGAHLTALSRTKIGDFQLKDAWKLSEVLN
ncbi:MAG: tRNA pseudouridine(55) synthase TruB [Flavobacteriales bacterium]|nr:tRNA pseudouridine(55) synthase TruB [Flavobacteriales bacterium]